ncbi:MAG: hypothetical protein ACK6D2_16150, partial [Planctomycetota bacterium]
MSLVAAVAVAAAALPQAPAPRLASLSPAGCARGVEVDVTLRGERGGDTVAVHFDEPGLAVVAVKPAADRCVVTLRAAPDCRLGAHRLRARSALGLSNLLTFHVGALPSLREERQGDAAIAVPLGVTVDGALRDGEIDRYTLDVPQGARVGGPPNRAPVSDDKGKRWFVLPGSVDGVVADDGAPVRFHVRGVKGQEVEVRVIARSLRSALDPVLIVRGADDRVLASNDDAAGMDSVVRFAPAADGEYVLEVRDLLRR